MEQTYMCEEGCFDEPFVYIRRVPCYEKLREEWFREEGVLAGPYHGSKGEDGWAVVQDFIALMLYARLRHQHVKVPSYHDVRQYVLVNYGVGFRNIRTFLSFAVQDVMANGFLVPHHVPIPDHYVTEFLDKVTNKTRLLKDQVYVGPTTDGSHKVLLTTEHYGTKAIPPMFYVYSSENRAHDYVRAGKEEEGAVTLRQVLDDVAYLAAEKDLFSADDLGDSSKEMLLGILTHFILMLIASRCVVCGQVMVKDTPDIDVRAAVPITMSKVDNACGELCRLALEPHVAPIVFEEDTLLADYDAYIKATPTFAQYCQGAPVARMAPEEQVAFDRGMVILGRWHLWRMCANQKRPGNAVME
jgi:hypothetical protein